MIPVHVRFRSANGIWSKRYTYKSEIAIPPNSVVLVPTGDFYSVGKVVAEVEGFEFKPNVNYRFIIRDLTGDIK